MVISHARHHWFDSRGGCFLFCLNEECGDRRGLGFCHRNQILNLGLLRPSFGPTVCCLVNVLVMAILRTAPAPCICCPHISFLRLLALPPFCLGLTCTRKLDWAHQTSVSARGSNHPSSSQEKLSTLRFLVQRQADPLILLRLAVQSYNLRKRKILATSWLTFVVQAIASFTSWCCSAATAAAAATIAPSITSRMLPCPLPAAPPRQPQ